MRKILVIADDLSGAAEIAGIGVRYGLPTRLLREPPAKCDDGLTVVDTDSRSLHPADAAKVVSDAVAGISLQDVDLIYKKTDSAFRGNILVEVEGLMERFQIGRALLVPQNPSRGRTIRDGVYRIDGVPLDQTAFAHDPDHPMSTADPVRMLGVPQGRPVACLPPDSPLLENGITIGMAWDDASIRRWADEVDPHVLAAGGAEFFASILQTKGHSASRPFITSLSGTQRLFVCGSASAYAKQLLGTAREKQIPVLAMPDDVFRGAELGRWSQSVCNVLSTGSSGVVAITHPIDRSAQTSNRLHNALAELVWRVLDRCVPDHLLLEGGATASAVCRRMRWSKFEVIGELDTGVVQLSVRDSPVRSVLIKPGSYPWSDCVWNPSTADAGA